MTKIFLLSVALSLPLIFISVVLVILVNAPSYVGSLLGGISWIIAHIAAFLIGEERGW